MASVDEKIFQKFSIDIKNINLIKLYGIENPDMSTETIEKLLKERRQKWQQSVNGANEKYAERDKIHLTNADKYEVILRDKKLRKELFDYYIQNSRENNVQFAKTFFELVSDTTKIQSEHVSFFFAYFQEQRPHKKAILELLKKEYSYRVVGKQKEDEEEDCATPKGKKKIGIIENLFEKETILMIRKCENFYETALKDQELCNRFPNIKDSMRAFLQINNDTSIDTFSIWVKEKKAEMYNLKCERGQNYGALVDLFNVMQDVLTRQDIINNFEEFKLLICYPKLTPYMYLFENMKLTSFKKFSQIACNEYGFRDINDFILSYFKCVYDNFGIFEQSIIGLLKKAEKDAKRQKALDAIDKALGKKKENKKSSLVVSVLSLLMYWPIYLFFAIFEIIKFVVDYLRYIALICFVPILYFVSKFWYEDSGMTLKTLKNYVSEMPWLVVGEDMAGYTVTTMFDVIMCWLVYIVLIVALYLLPTVLITHFLWNSAVKLRKCFDWIGVERTLKENLSNCRENVIGFKNMYKERVWIKSITASLCNLILTIIVIVFLYLLPHVIEGVSPRMVETWSQTEETVKMNEVETQYVIEANEIESVIEVSSVEPYYIITVDMANVRSGPGTDKDVIATATRNQRFEGTGKQEIVQGDTLWYEIFLDKYINMTGWVSSEVVDLVEE